MFPILPPVQGCAHLGSKRCALLEENRDAAPVAQVPDVSWVGQKSASGLFAFYTPVKCGASSRRYGVGSASRSAPAPPADRDAFGLARNLTITGAELLYRQKRLLARLAEIETTGIHS